MNTRVLPIEEHEKLSATGFPPIVPFVNPPDTEVIVVEDEEGKIVGSMAVMRFTHFEAAYVDPEHKGNPAVVRPLVQAAMKSANRFPEKWIMGLAHDPKVKRLLEKLGGRKMEGCEVFILPRLEE